MKYYIQHHPFITGIVLSVASVIWTLLASMMLLKYGIVISTIDSSINFCLYVILLFGLISSLIIQCLFNASYQLLDTYRYLSLGFMIALIITSVIIRSQLM